MIMQDDCKANTAATSCAVTPEGKAGVPGLGVESKEPQIVHFGSQNRYFCYTVQEAYTLKRKMWVFFLAYSRFGTVLHW